METLLDLPEVQTSRRELPLADLRLHPLLDQVASPPCGELPDGTALDVHLSPYLIVQQDNTILVGKELYLKLLEGEEILAPALVVDLSPAQQLEVILSCAIARQTFNQDQLILVAAHWLIEEVKKSRSRKASKAAKQRHQNRDALGTDLPPSEASRRVLDQCQDRFQLPIRLVKKARHLLENHPAEAQKVMAGQITLIDALKAMVAKLQAKPRSSNRNSNQTQPESTSGPSRGEASFESESFSDGNPREMDLPAHPETGPCPHPENPGFTTRSLTTYGQEKPSSPSRSITTSAMASSPDTADEDEAQDPYAGSLVLEITQTSREIARALLQYYHPQRCQNIVEDLQELIAND